MRRDSEQFARGQKYRLVVEHHARVGRDGYFAVGEGIQRVNGDVGRGAGLQLDFNLNVLGRVVGHFPDFDLARIVGLHNRIAKLGGVHAKRHILDEQRFLVLFLNAAAHLHLAAAQPVVVQRHINHAARDEIRVERGHIAAQHFNAAFDEFAEIVRQNLGCQSHRNAFHALRQQQRKLDGQRDGFAFAAIVRQLPFGEVGVEQHFQPEFAQPRLNVARRRRTVAGAHIAPVALRVEQQVFLPHVHNRVVNRSVAVRVVLHRLPDHIGDFIKPSVVHFLHGVQNAALHGLEAVADGGHGTFQNHVGGIVEEPFLVHIVQRVAGGFGVVRDTIFHGVRKCGFFAFQSIGQSIELNRLGFYFNVGNQKVIALRHFHRFQI